VCPIACAGCRMALVTGGGSRRTRMRRTICSTHTAHRRNRTRSRALSPVRLRATTTGGSVTLLCEEGANPRCRRRFQAVPIARLHKVAVHPFVLVERPVVHGHPRGRLVLADPCEDFSRPLGVRDTNSGQPCSASFSATAVRPVSCKRHVVLSTIWAPVVWHTLRNKSMQEVRNISRSCFGLGGWRTPSTSKNKTAASRSIGTFGRSEDSAVAKPGAGLGAWSTPSTFNNET
jgi:hypothetical protein